MRLLLSDWKGTVHPPHIFQAPLLQQHILSICLLILPWHWTTLLAQMVKNLPAMQKTCVQSLGREDFLEKGMATPQVFLLENSMESQRVGYD